MRKVILILLLFVSAVVNGQTPAGYIKANMRFKWTAGIFDSALHVPQYNGTPSGIRNGAWVGDGAVAVDTVNNLFYFRSSGAWHQTSSGAGWLLTGNSGTTSSNFIGTTDNQPLSFRVNNNWAGRIYTDGSVFIGDSSGVNNSALNNAGFGRYSLYNNTTGEGNTGSGAYSLYSNTTGWNNTGSGVYSLGNNTTGWSNTGSGVYSLRNNTTGSNNTGMGYAAGYNAKQKVDAQNQILIGAGTYGTRDSMTVIGASFMRETILRGKLIDSTLSAGVGTKAVRWNDATGEFTYADTTVGGGGSPAGSNKELQFNNSGAFGGTTGIKYGNASNERLTIWQTTSTDVPLTIKVAGDNSKAAIEIKDTTGSPYTSAIKFTPSVGGSPGASYIMQGYNGLILSAGNPPYMGSRDALVSIGISSVQNVFFRSYPYDVPGAPNNWVAKIRTAKTSAIGLAIDWGAAGQTGDLLQFRDNSNTVMARFDSIGKLGVNTVPVSYVDANGSLGAAITTTSSNITLDATHHTVIITSGTPTITLPAAASSNARRIYVVVNQTGSAVTISSYQNFSGSGITTVAANSSIQIQSDGSNWYRIL